jgi:Flp pilus assembly pilin Flp
MWWIELELVLVVRSLLSRHRRAARLVAQSTVEYALVGALVVIAAAAALTMLGNDINAVFTHISTTLRSAAGAP